MMTTLHDNLDIDDLGHEAAAPEPGAGASAPQLHLHALAPPGSPTQLPTLAAVRAGTARLTPVSTPSGRAVPAPLLVVGTSGGAGVSVTAVGAAAALREDYADDDVWPIVVDATAAGGDVATRAADAHRCVGSVQSWLAGPDPSRPAAVIDACGYTSTGVGVLAQAPAALPRRETFASVHRRLGDAGATAVFDGGAPVSARGIRVLLADPRIVVAVVVAARADAANRLLPGLQWLEAEFGEYAVADAAIVVTHQSVHDHQGVSAHLRTHLGGWVRGVFDIPYDPHLATGRTIRWTALREPTRAAYRTLLRELQK